MSKYDDDAMELSMEELEELLEELEEFDNMSFSLLAQSGNYEIIPTATEDGELLTKEELSLLESECRRQGFSVLYRIDKEDGETLLVGPKGKVMLLKEGMQ
jgi:hypothetical protein